MDKKTLKSYRAIRNRLKKLTNEIEELRNTEVRTIPGKVKSSSSEFPYLPCRVGTLLEDPEEAAGLSKRILKKEFEYDELEKRLEKIESYVDQIEDILDKTVIEMYYLDEPKKNQGEIAGELGTSRGTISRIIMKYK